MASIGSLEVSLSLNAASFNGTVAQVDRNLKAMGSELQALRAKGTDYEKSINGLSQKQNILARSFDAATIKLQEQRRRYDELVASGDATEAQIERQANAVNRAQAEYNRLERQLGDVTEQLRVQSSQWTQAGQRLQEVGNKLQSVGNNLKSIGKDLSMKLTAPILALGAGAFKAAVDFESAFAGVRKTVDTSEEGFKKLEQGIRDMAKELPASASDIAAVAESAGQLGIAEDKILSFSRTIIDLGESTNMTREQAATEFARFANIVGMSQDNFDRLGSSIVGLGNSMATTEAEIMSMGMRLAAQGAQVGMSEAQIMALAGTMSSLGIQAEMGGTAMTTILKKMQSAAMDGGAALGTWAEVAQMSSGEFKKLYDASAIDGLDAVVKGLKTISSRGENLTEVLRDMGIKGIYESDVMMRMVGASDLLSSAVETSTSAWEENTALTNEAAQRYATTASQLAMLKNKVIDIGITLGNILIPMVMRLLELIQPWIEKFASLSEGTQKLIVIIAGIAAAIGPIIVVIGTLISSLGTIVSAMGSLALSLGVAGGATSAFGAALAVVTGPIGLTVAAVAALGVGAVIVAKEVSKASLEVKSFKNNVSESTAKAVGSFLGLSDKATVALNQLAWSGKEVTSKMATKMIETYKQMGEQVLTEMQSDHAKELSEMQKHFAKSDALTKEQEQAIIERVQASHKAKETMTAEGNARIAKIWRLAADEHRQITDDEYQEISAIQENMKNTAIKYMSESEVEQKVILENLKNEASKITTEQAAEVVRNSLKQKEGVVKEAEKQYNEMYKWAIRQRDETGAMSAEEAQAVIDDAERKRDETVKSAKDMHTKVVTEAQKQAEEHVNKVDWETGEILSKWGVFKAKHAGIWNAVESQISNITDSIKEISTKAYDFIKSKIGDALKEVVTFSKEQLDKLKEFWNENGKAIIGIVQLYFGQIKANIEAVMKIIKGIFEVVWPMIASVFKIAWNTIKLTVGNTLDLILGVIQAVMKVIQGDWKGAWETIMQTAVDIMDNVTEYFRNVNLIQIGKDIIQGLIDGIGSMVEGVKTSASYMMDQIKEKFGEKFEELKTSIIDWFTSIPGVIESKLSEWGTAISNWFTSLSANTAAKLDEWWIAISDWFSSVPEKIFAKLSEWGLAILEWSNQQNEENKRQFGEWGDAIAEWFSSIPEKITSKLSDWGTAIKDWFTSIPDVIQEKFNEWLTTITTWFSDTTQEITSRLSDWGTTIGSWFGEMPSSIGEWISEWWDKMATWFSEIPEKITTKFEEWWEAIKNWFTSVPDKPEIKNMGKNMIDKVAEGNKEKKPELLDKLGKILVDVALGVFAVAGVALLAAGREIIKRLIDGIQEAKKSLETKVKEIKDTIINKIKETNLLQVGRDIVSGLIKGIGEKVKDVGKKAVELGQTVITNVSNVLQRRSPSRVMIAIGKDVVKGFVIGLSDVTEIRKSSEELAEAAIPNFTERLDITKEAMQKAQQIVSSSAKADAAEIEKLQKEAEAKRVDISKKSTDKISSIKSAANKKRKSLTSEQQAQIKKSEEQSVKDREKITKQYADKIAKIEAKSADAKFKSLKEYVEAQKAAGEMTAKQEAEFWRYSATAFKDGTKEKTNALKAYNKAHSDMLKSQFDNEKKYVEQRKKFDTLSQAEELEIYEKYVKQYKEGSDERMYYEEKVYETKKAISEKIKSINNDYLKQTQDINKKLIDEEQKLNDTYKNTLESRYNTIKGYFGLFDEVKLNDPVDSVSLTKNLSDQVNALSQWRIELSKLEIKGLSKAIIDELEAMGPSAMAQLEALNRMTDTELTQYKELYEKKMHIAREAAVKELEPLDKETKTNIQKLRQTANDELNTLNKEWQSEINKILLGTDQRLGSMKNMGKSAVQGLIDGMKGMQGSLQKTANDIAETVSKTIKNALDFKGVNEMATNAGNATEKMVNNTSSNSSAESEIKKIEKIKKEKMNPALIVVQSVLDSRVIGESVVDTVSGKQYNNASIDALTRGMSGI
ncbi:phage tail tape measure protein [Lysinibacillus sp. UGB7]|uniref:phage tail tape measure protein n=1 Tax=Lysinibacillus sp. UGB7 TaxID=3411039 RepID=UPI003B82B889